MERRFSEWALYRQKPAAKIVVWVYIISAMAYTLGNVFWSRLGDANLYFIPLAIFLLTGAITIRLPYKNKSVRQIVCLDWIVLLAAGNVIKQLMYDKSDIAERLDIYWGIFLACVFIPRIIYPPVYYEVYKCLLILRKFCLNRIKKLLTWATGMLRKRR